MAKRHHKGRKGGGKKRHRGGKHSAGMEHLFGRAHGRKGSRKAHRR